MERKYDSGGDLNGGSNPTARTHEPGKATLTDGLVLQRKARDENGVAEGAEQLVSRAASGSGEPLPGELRTKFESSLGADLGAVRVHTGADSVGAAQSVSARAYTVGNDIHFGAGQYNPSTSDGQHLIAHEVAHAVQQAGVARKVQFKLEVSTPADHLESEADHAASEMVIGKSAAITASHGIARTIHRDPLRIGQTERERQVTAGEVVDSATVAINRMTIEPPEPWEWGAAGAGSGEVDQPWSAAPQFPILVQMREACAKQGATGMLSKMEESAQKFTTDWSALSGAWNAVASITTRKGDEAGLLALFERAKNMKALVLGGSVSDSFPPQPQVEGPSKLVTPDLDANQLKEPDKGALEESKAKVLAEDAKTSRAVTGIKELFRILSNDVFGASKTLKNCKITKIEKQNILLGKDEQKLHQHRDEVADGIASAGNMVKSLAEGPGPAAEAGGKLISGAVVAKYNRSIEQCRGLIAANEARIKDLEQEIAFGDAMHALTDAVQKFSNNIAPLMAELAVAQQDRDIAYRRHGSLVRDLAQKTRGPKGKPRDEKDAKQLGSLVEAIPEIERLVADLGAIKERATDLPAYSKESGRGGALADNRDDFYSHLSTLRGTPGRVAPKIEEWSSRLKQIKDLGAAPERDPWMPPK